jgi:hypothetical protein
MSKLIASFFTNSGSPATGLSPTIRIWEVTGLSSTLVVTDAPMTEVGDGFYKYEFTTYDPSSEYLFRSDGGASLPIFERYQKASNRNSASEVWNADSAEYTTLNTFGDKVNDIATDTTALRIDVTAALSVLDILLKYESNRTRVDPSANTLTIYDDDGTTVLQVFNLKDENGNPSSTCIYEREPQ